MPAVTSPSQPIFSRNWQSAQSHRKAQRNGSRLLKWPKPETSIQAFLATGQLAPVTTRVGLHFCRHVQQPALVSISLLLIPAVAFMVGKVLGLGIPLGNSQALSTSVSVPTDKVHHVREIVTVGATISGGAGIGL